MSAANSQFSRCEEKYIGTRVQVTGYTDLRTESYTFVQIDVGR